MWSRLLLLLVVAIALTAAWIAAGAYIETGLLRLVVTALGVLFSAWVAPIWWLGAIAIDGGLRALRYLGQLLDQSQQQAQQLIRDWQHADAPWLVEATTWALDQGHPPDMVRAAAPLVAERIGPWVAGPIDQGIVLSGDAIALRLAGWRLKLWIALGVWTALLLGPPLAAAGFVALIAG